MTIWKYIIKTNNGMILTKDPFYAERHSKNGNIVFCKRETNLFKFNK